MRQDKWRHYWSVRDDGLYIFEDRELIAKIHPEHFPALVADLAEHVKWQVRNAKEPIRE